MVNRFLIYHLIKVAKCCLTNRSTVCVSNPPVNAHLSDEAYKLI